MDVETEGTFANTKWRQARILLAGACTFGAMAVVAGAALALSRHLSPAPGSGAGWFLVLLLCGSLGAGLVLASFAARSAARVADDVLEGFRRGSALADWQFAPSDWSTFAAGERALAERDRRLSALAILAVPTAMALWFGCTAAQGDLARIGVAMLVGTGAILAYRGSMRLGAAASHDWSDPRVVIGRNAVYCGGMLQAWGVGTLVLADVRVASPAPMRLEFSIGSNRLVQALDAALAAASLVGGASAAGPASQVVRVTVLVPPGRESEALRLRRTLLGHAGRPAPGGSPSDRPGEAGPVGPEAVGVPAPPVGSARRSVAAAVVLAVAAIGPALSDEAGIRVEVPTRACPTRGQTADLPPPRLPAHVAVVLPSGAAGRLAFYRAAWREGVLAPTGWICAAFSGSTGITLIVAPPGADLADDAPLKGAAVVRSLVTGGTSGRFRVAEVAARAFPAYRAFARRVAAEGSDDAIVFSPYAGDRMTSLAQGAAAFATPAGAEGLGTLILAPDRRPVSGVARIDGDPTAPTLHYLAVRLDPADADLQPAILRQAPAPGPGRP